MVKPLPKIETPDALQGAGSFGAVAALLIVNGLFAHWLDYPPIYCWGRHLAPLLGAILEVVFFFGVIAFAVTLFGNGLGRKAMSAFLALVLIASLPSWADTLLRLGATCRLAPESPDSYVGGEP